MVAAPSSKPRAMLLPSEATNDGSRRLREILRRQTFGAVARRLGVHESYIRRWAREEDRPSRLHRLRAEEVLGIPGAAWDEVPKV